RAEKIDFAVNDQLRADRARRRAPSLDNGGERDVAPVLAPLFGGLENVGVGCEHQRPLVSNREWRIANGYKIGVTFLMRYSPLALPSSSHLPQPGLGVSGAAAFERGDQAGYRVQIVNGAHFVDMRQHGLDAARTRLAAFEAN